MFNVQSNNINRTKDFNLQLGSSPPVGVASGVCF